MHFGTMVKLANSRNMTKQMQPTLAPFRNVRFASQVLS